MKYGSACIPRFGKTVNAEAISNGVASQAPIARGRYGSNLPPSPKRRAITTTFLIPMSEATLIVGTFRDSVKAWRIVICPLNFPS